MNIRSILPCLVALACFVHCGKPTETKQIITGIAGKVTDASTDEPITGATITTDPISQSVETDSDGRYVLDNLTKDTVYKVTAVKEGYDTRTITVRVIEDQKYQSGNTQLSRVQPRSGVSSERLTLRKDENSVSLTIRNEGTGILKWSIEGYPNWLTLSKSVGETRGEEEVTVTVDRDRIPEGTYSVALQIGSNGGDREVTVDVEQPRLSLGTALIDFGTSGSASGFVVLNRGTGALEWRIDEDLAWLTPGELEGVTVERDSVTVTVSREGLAVGVYRGDLQITSLYGGVETLSVRVEVPRPDTEILSGPSEGEEIDSEEVRFTFAGRNIEGPVEFSYRITGEDWSPWSGETDAVFGGLDESSLVGEYTFEVRSRSFAGDVDETPAERRFAVDAIRGPALWLRPRAAEVDVGAEVTLEIVAEEMVNLMLAHLFIGFDAVRLELADVKASRAFWEQNGGELVWLVPAADAVDGLVEVSAGVGTGDPPGVSGTGILGTLTFRAMAAGTARVTVDLRTELRDPNNERTALKERVGADIAVR